MTSIIRQFAFALVLALPLSGAFAAEAYPSKPIHLLVPFPPGGATDSIARLVAQKLSDGLGQQVVVENRPGGGTIIATELAAKAPADGYTLLVVTAAFAVNPSLYPHLPYDSNKELAPVTLVSAAPNVLIVNPTVPANTVKELIAYAKAHPHQVNFGSAGNGTSNHLAGEMFSTMAGVDIVHVPYKGDAPSITDLLAGRIQMLFIGYGPVAQYVKTGALRAIAISSAHPSALVPGLPTIAESGVPGFESAVWNGIMVPAQTPPAIVNRLQSEIAKILAQPGTREKIVAMGFDPIGDSPAEFQAYLAAESQRLGKVVKDAGIHVD
ncbi:MAG: tripartite tricarboxylate transporter substrate binding protein [Casimicrobiaceae bacterium]